ncbi:macrophage mannose receptor 1-like isoform X2 [Tachypleus tridentatus]|uniref:macrophage mannose receptor 1-like isoform X2 n=1 Tax=Tachypleus tridentatus TaxID=6853 RepID=UPI003FD1381D
MPGPQRKWKSARKKDPLWSSTYWIGLHALGMDGQFEWSDGTLTDYTNWLSNNHELKAEEKCVHVSVFSGRWKDGNCGLLVRGFFCKHPNTVRPTSRPTLLPTPLPGNCPKNWTGYGDKCFLFHEYSEDTKLSWREALKTCRSMGENHDLASIHSTGEQMFLTALLGRYRSSAWIGLSKLQGSFNNFGWSDNSKFDFQAWGPGEPSGFSEKCVTMMSTKRATGQWEDIVCEKKQSYICQRYKDPQISTSPPPETNCSLRGEGYVAYQSSCYKLVHKDKKTWFDAEDACVREKGHLVSVTNPYEQAFIHSVLVQTNETVWNGLYSHDATDRFRWIDTWPIYYTNWGPSQPENPTINATRCVGFDKNKQWKVLSCQQESAFMCKVTDLIPPVIDIPSDSGTCPEHLKSWLNIQGPSCFYIEQENNQMSWGEASLFCRRTGARLVTFHSLHDLLVLEPYLQPEAISLWIGLIRKHDGGYDWEDGSVVDFTYWGDGEPSNPDAQLCVEMYEHNLRWNDEVCSNRRGFICQVEKVPPEPTCETEDGRWKYFKDGDACYHVLKANLAKKYTWHDAEDYCTKEGGHLVSIHSKKENDFIQKMIQETGSFIIKSYWIGFHALGLDGQFEWTDGSLTEFINWDNTNEKFEAEEKCVLMFPNSGTWVDHHCDLQERGAVCKVANSKLVTPAPTIAPTPLPGNCPDGWYTLGDKCYLFSEENGEEEMTWQEAREACRKKGSNHDLVSIHSTKEQMFLTSALAFSKTSVWIGLKRAKGSNRRFIWSDNSPFDFDHWAPREPNSYVDGCVEMIGAPPSAGKWNDRKCTEKAAYICQRYKDPSLPESRPPNHVDCSHLDQGYVGYRETCYKLFIEASQMKSWKKAEEFCVGQGGHLTSVTDLFDQAFLYSLLDVTVEYIWNGFHAKFDQDRFRWTDNWPVYYTKWTKGQPGATINNNTRCVAFQETNEWTVVPCDTKLSLSAK